MCLASFVCSDMIHHHNIEFFSFLPLRQPYQQVVQTLWGVQDVSDIISFICYICALWMVEYSAVLIKSPNNPLDIVTFVRQHWHAREIKVYSGFCIRHYFHVKANCTLYRRFLFWCTFVCKRTIFLSVRRLYYFSVTFNFLLGTCLNIIELIWQNGLYFDQNV